MNKGWRKEPVRHGLAARGIKSGRKDRERTLYRAPKTNVPEHFMWPDTDKELNADAFPFPNKMYYVTTIDNKDKILSEGIDPDDPNETMQNMGTIELEGSPDPYHDHPFYSLLGIGTDKEDVFFEIDTNGLNLRLNPLIYPEGREELEEIRKNPTWASAYTYDKIDPNRIKYIGNI